MGEIAHADAVRELAALAWGRLESRAAGADGRGLDGRERRWRTALWDAVGDEDAPMEVSHDALRLMLFCQAHSPAGKPDEAELEVCFSAPTARPLVAVILEARHWTDPAILELGPAAAIYEVPRRTLQEWIQRGLLTSMRKHEGMPHLVYDREVSRLAGHHQPGGGRDRYRRLVGRLGGGA